MDICFTVATHDILICDSPLLVLSSLHRQCCYFIMPAPLVHKAESCNPILARKSSCPLRFTTAPMLPAPASSILSTPQCPEKRFHDTDLQPCQCSYASSQQHQCSATPKLEPVHALPSRTLASATQPLHLGWSVQFVQGCCRTRVVRPPSVAKSVVVC